MIPGTPPAQESYQQLIALNNRAATFAIKFVSAWSQARFWMVIGASILTAGIMAATFDTAEVVRISGAIVVVALGIGMAFVVRKANPVPENTAPLWSASTPEGLWLTVRLDSRGAILVRPGDTLQLDHSAFASEGEAALLGPLADNTILSVRGERLVVPSLMDDVATARVAHVVHAAGASIRDLRPARTSWGQLAPHFSTSLTPTSHEAGDARPTEGEPDVWPEARARRVALWTRRRIGMAVVVGLMGPLIVLLSLPFLVMAVGFFLLLPGIIISVMMIRPVLQLLGISPLLSGEVRGGVPTLRAARPYALWGVRKLPIAPGGTVRIVDVLVRTAGDADLQNLTRVTLESNGVTVFVDMRGQFPTHDFLVLHTWSRAVGVTLVPDRFEHLPEPRIQPMTPAGT